MTYEWTFALGVDVKVIPILLEPTPLHPRLEVLQHLDFSIHRSARPWDKLLALPKEVSANSRTGILELSCLDFRPMRNTVAAPTSKSHLTARDR